MDEKQCTNMKLRMTGSGIRFYDLRNGKFIPLNSNTIEMIDFERPTEEVKMLTVEEMLDSDTGQVDMDDVPDYINPTATFEKEKAAAPPSREEKAATGLATLIEKSSCKHELDKQELNKVGSKKGTRYFNVCSFCGWRGRFVKESSLTAEQRDNAKIYQAS